jgi:CrcB protein
VSAATPDRRPAARLARTRPAALGAAAVGLGGAAGALARAGLAEALPHEPATWPWATFLANLGGTVLLAWLTTRLFEAATPSRYRRLVLGTGFCGAFTTFSTFQIETISLARDGAGGLAVAYAVASLAAGMAFATATTLLARRGRSG